MSRKSVDRIDASPKSKKRRTVVESNCIDLNETSIDENLPNKSNFDEDFDGPDISDESVLNDVNGSDIVEQDRSIVEGTPNIVESSPSTKKKVSKTQNKKRGLSPLLDLLDVNSTASTNFCVTGGTAYLSYNENTWSPLFLYRLPSDIALSAIRDHGTEGIGRVEIGSKMGLDTSAKAGNRRVSSYILTACNEHPHHIGQFQKMEGKIRCIKYFWKADREPEQFKKLFDDFKKFAGMPCPFKLGQVMKFPNCNLSTLRISDVTLRRLNDILEMIANKRVVVTIHKISKFISRRERAYGYDFTIDKKSLMKCLKALESAHLLTVFETNVLAESVETKVQIVCHREIQSAEDPEVLEAVRTTIDEYHQEGRVFPHGQLRFSMKRRTEIGEQLAVLDSFEDIAKECINGITFSQRYNLLRVQISRSAVMSLKKPQASGIYDKGEEDFSFSDRDRKANITIVSDPTSKNEESVVLERLNCKPEKLSTNPEKSVVPQSSSNSKVQSEIDFLTEYGYQSKAIRCFVAHEIAFQLVFGHAEGTKPSCYELFPPSESFSSWQVRTVEDLTVYVDEESPLRFLPPLPPFKDVQRGWFMVQDFLAALPLSAFVLIVHVNKKIDDLLQSYLSDPIKRHICIGCLPNEIRNPILKDKKVVRQLEHIMLTNCALGLMAMAPNPDVKLFSSPRASMFFVSRKAVLHDTSTSGRGYASVTLPLSSYDKYNYLFNRIDDLVLYWHHLRAIVQSTPLSFRNDLNSEEINLARHKKYSLGQFDKRLVIREPSENIAEITPLGPREGCAGFDSALFIHLKRHWDVDPRQNSYVGWYIARFRRQSDKIRSIVESRVANLRKDWNSYVKTLMPSDLELQKNKKKQNESLGAVYPSTRAMLAADPIVKRRIPSKKLNPKKKRPLDSVDIISEQNRLHLRSRFNSREKDMLIMIRAVGFFLNPVYRFWLDPSVVRDIMHEYIPESRCKTVQCLMAAAVREMVRPPRLAYLQRIVRNLSTFQEMRDLRFLLASSPLSTAESKASFFKNAFDVANRLLFMENQVLPMTATSDKQFEVFLKSSQLVVSTEQSIAAPIPLRSQVPTTLAQIHHCVAINILLSILIHSTDGAFSESILDQLSASVICNALQVLRADGLVSRSRILDHELMVITKNQAVLSYYFRHFFSHRFHPDVMEQSLLVFETIEDSVEEMEELQGDLVGILVAATSSFYNNNDLEISVDDEVFTMFEQTAIDHATHSIKQIRYLENADLHLEQIHIYESSSLEQPQFPSSQSIISRIDWSQTASKYPPQPFETFLLDVPVSMRRNLRHIYSPILSCREFGARLSDIQDATNMELHEIETGIEYLTKNSQVITVGVEVQRWVAAEFAKAWCVKVGHRLTSPRPWTMPSGDICPATVRWMGESVLMMIISSPGITLKEVCSRFEFALQPVAVHDLITVLELAGCIRLLKEVFENMSLSSLFQRDVPQIEITYLLPTVDCIERFSRIFGGISLLPAMTGRSDSDKLETQRSSAVDEDLGELNLTLPILQKAN